MEKLTVVLGPTASGKTDYATRLAKECGGAVVSADSRQVYAGMNIGTAKPREAWKNETHDTLKAETVDGISHYLFNIREPNNQIALPEWQSAAFAALDHIISQRKRPILAGGTMLYIDSVVFNYDIPTIPPNEELRAELEATPTQELYNQLKQQDLKATQFIQPQNKRRIVRALEVMASTGKTFSQLRRKRKPKYACKLVGLSPDWDELKKRITSRVDAMLADGLIEETQILRKTYGADMPLLRTMNYAEASSVIDQDMDVKKARDQMIRANLRYARRQMSWWRGRSEIEWTSS